MGFAALDAALKGDCDTSMSVKLPSGMFITTHPWPFWALLPVYSCVFFFKGRFIARFKDMKLWGLPQTPLIFRNVRWDTSTCSRGHVTVDTELLKVWRLAPVVMTSARGCVCVTSSVRAILGGVLALWSRIGCYQQDLLVLDAISKAHHMTQPAHPASSECPFDWAWAFTSSLEMSSDQ